MTDISPSLYKTIKDAFDKSMASNKTIQGILEKLGSDSVKINHGESYKYAEEIGKALADAFQKNLSSEILPDGKMYFNIAKAVVEPLLKANSNLAEAVAADVQTKLNESAGIGIKAIKPGVNQDKIDGIINRLANEEFFDDVKWILNEPVVNFTESAVDDTIKTNVEFQGESGLKPKIRRITIGKCCDWCEELAGTYDYDDAPEDIYRRHEFCRCIVEVDVGDGKRQDVWDKKIRSREESAERIRKIEQLVNNQLEQRVEAVKNQILELPHNIREGKQNAHIPGTKEYADRKNVLIGKGLHGPSEILVSMEEVEQIIEEFAGMGIPNFDKNGRWDNTETIISNDKTIGVVYNNLTGEHVQTDVFKIHYSTKGCHIVPDYPSKKK